MKVIVAGFSKTGTKTMNASLTTLGYNVYDYEHNFYHLRKQWIKILTKGGTKEDFYEMYKDVDASCDMPFSLFWEEILEAFPDAKIVFMQRKSEDDWLRSLEQQSRSAESNKLFAALPFFSPSAHSLMKYNHHVGRTVFACPPQPFWSCYRGISPTVAKKRYRDHNTSVLERAPKDQLLVFNISDGWEPLCKFLGKSVPSTPFPHKNKRGSLIDDYLKHSPIFHQMQREMMVSVGILGIACVAGAVHLYKHPESIKFLFPSLSWLNPWS